ncbi:TraX family protein [Paenibacillus abyssi]|uniref:Conjugal transfer protein TraX n=1 Tax=Paenibacillus abyssi TaxID=1340531 RepID=A0A917LE34_9BACL|nr:TraX family protein [Paenibacillus abyssi]GGG14900.1 hypothetical protein GCM10010916_34770 [Paenibacillus abyssi]
MQILAMLTMLIDHVGIVFFPGDSIWRIIGRIAFPLYAFALVVGYYHTKNMKRYLVRLAIVAILSQLPFQLAFGDGGINVVAALLVCLLVLYAIDRWRHPLFIMIVVASAALLLEAFDFDYGYYGLALVLIYRYSRSHMQVALHLLLNLVILYDKGWLIQMYSILPTILLVYLPLLLRAMDRLQPPRWVWRSFYPGHLALLALWQLTAV